MAVAPKFKIIHFKISALAAIMPKIQNGAFVYHNKFKVRLSEKVIHPATIFCLHCVTTA